MFASAGTFTSCKDYDDDISNLQEQINTINTSLDELSDKINGLGAGVTDFKYENGKLIIVTDKGTNFEVTLPEADGIKELEIKDGILYADGEVVGAVAGESGTAVSVEVKDGVLYINGEAQELNDEVGSKVVIVDNGDGTYTLTADGTSCVLPKASVDVAVKILDEKDGQSIVAYTYFTNLSKEGITSGNEHQGGIQWGTAEKYKGDWKGLKPVAKGQLLVGQTSTIAVQTLAATYDLSTAKLTLVNTLGETAPVTVTPVAEGKQGPAISDSRAADKNGMWDLQIAMTSDVTADNIDTKFAAKDPTDDYKFKNVKYALAIDGKVVTDYEIYVDTKEKKATKEFSFTVSGGTIATTNLNFKVNGIEKNVTREALPLGTTTTLYLTPVSGYDQIDFLYDSYIEIMDEDMAERYGITVEGMSVTVSEAAAAIENLPIKIHALDVNGNETVSPEMMLDFAATTVEGETIAAQTYTVMPTTATEGEFVLVDLGNTFTSLTAEQADKISKRTDDGAATWYTTTDNKTFALHSDPAIEGGLKKIANQKDILYYASKEDALKDALKNDEDLAIKVKGGKASTIRTITYAAIPVTTFKATAETGMNVITIILQDNDNNQIKKVSADYTVNLPAFDDVLEANAAQNLWDVANNTYNARVISKSRNGEIELLKTFISKKDSNGKEYYDVNTADGSLVYELTYTDFDKKEQTVEVNGKTQEPLTGKLVEDGELIHDIEVTATLYPLGTSYTNLKVTKTFKIYLKSVFEDATLTYYGSDNKPIEGPMTLEDYQYIYSGDNTDNKKTGLFVNFDGEIREYWFDGVDKFTNGPEILPAAVNSEKANLRIDRASSQEDGQVNPFIYLGDGATGAKLTATVTYVNSATRGALQLSNVAGGTSGTVVFTFVDNMGVQTTATLEYKK